MRFILFPQRDRRGSVGPFFEGEGIELCFGRSHRRILHPPQEPLRRRGCCWGHCHIRGRSAVASRPLVNATAGCWAARRGGGSCMRGEAGMRERAGGEGLGWRGRAGSRYIIKQEGRARLGKRAGQAGRAEVHRQA
jgi:hypothetical protein